MSDSTQHPQHPWEISPQEVVKLRKSGEDFLFLDCRTLDEYEAASIDGTTLIPMQDLDIHLPELRSQRDRMIVVLCRSGRRSMTVTTVMRNDGFTNVKSMAGGIERWAVEIDPSVKR